MCNSWQFWAILFLAYEHMKVQRTIKTL